jgi:ABC-type dipeptide/oligopeptide/nickel transport system ATPase component
MSIEDLRVLYNTSYGLVRAVDGFSMYARPGEMVGICGPSGCGKTTCFLTLLGIAKGVPGLVSGKAVYRGRNLLADLGNYVWREQSPTGDIIRKDFVGWDRHYAALIEPYLSTELYMVFQEPRQSLDPYLKVGEQLTQVLSETGGYANSECMEKAEGLLYRLGFRNPAATFDKFPFQLSGGECQRLVLAVALAVQPNVIIADELTNGVDYATQVLLFKILRQEMDQRQVTVILISHELVTLVSQCDSIVFFDGSTTCEIMPRRKILQRDFRRSHPTTVSLIQDAFNIVLDTPAAVADSGGSPADGGRRLQRVDEGHWVLEDRL